MEATASNSAERPARTTVIKGWRIHELELVTSTNLVAAGLPAWEAVRANRQSAGRGRFQRRWVSDQGGLWLSAVVPAPPVVGDLPLAVGLAVCDVLRRLGVADLRMRWPNDILVGNRKLAGLLLDQFSPGLVVAGIGLNVVNEPGRVDRSLESATIRLADLLEAIPPMFQLTTLILEALRETILILQNGGFETLLPRVNQLWGMPRKVELDLDGRIESGDFTRVDGHGRLLLHRAGKTAVFEPHQVRHLREL